MGCFSDLYGSVCSASAPRSGFDRATYKWLYDLSQKVDYTLPSTYAVKTAVGKIAQTTGTPTGGTYALTVSVPTYNNGQGLTYTTAGIAFDATAATIQTALDTASPAGITNAAIVVADENTKGQHDGYCTYTCAQELVSHVFTISNDISSLTGGSPVVGAVTYTTYGQPKRNALYALVKMGVIAIASLHNAGSAATFTKPTSLVKRPRMNVLRALNIWLQTEEGGNLASAELVRLYPELESLEGSLN